MEAYFPVFLSLLPRQSEIHALKWPPLGFGKIYYNYGEKRTLKRSTLSAMNICSGIVLSDASIVDCTPPSTTAASRSN
jgi:hypothetical protein